MKGRKNQIGARSKYSRAFRDQVARDYENGDLSYRQIAEKYELPSPELPKWWVRSYRKMMDIGVSPQPPMTEAGKSKSMTWKNGWQMQSYVRWPMVH